MSYEVLARKWRPQTFDDIAGQPLVTKALRNAIDKGRIAHAFLFSGTRGVGKTTAARILAKALNCEKELSAEPCNECNSCVEVSEARSMDVQEIDAASNTGVDNIRELREGVRYGTARDRFKIYIIDEVHMLSKGAFNALLKTLEEPPPHVKFILATTELHRIPDTILSRCQQYEFRPLSFSTLLERLAWICKQEGIEISDYGLRAIAAVARGSMRDAQSTLDKMIALGGAKIVDEDVRTLLGVVDEDVLISLVESVACADLQAVLHQIRGLEENGVEPHNFCHKMLVHLRNLLVCRVAGWDEQLLNISEIHKDAVVAQAEQLSDLDLIRFYDLVNRVSFEIRTHPQPFLHLEMALVKLVELARLPTLEEVVGRLSGGGSREPSLPPRKSELLRKAVPKRAAQVRPEAHEAKADYGPEDPAPTATSPEVAPEDVVARLRSHLETNHPGFYSLLAHASDIEFADGKLTVAFSHSEASFHHAIDSPDKRQLLSKMCQEIAGHQASLEICLGKEEAKKNESEDPTEDPGVKKFLETFPGKLSIERNLEN
jgi:DNA polymerase-3 subunit gamma/tau